MKKLYIMSILVSVGLVITMICKLATINDQNIPLEVLFGDPVKTMYRISPDNTFISYLALGQTPETKKILNIWVKSCNQDDDKQITFDSSRSIRSYFWSFDNRTIFYVQDKKGDENWSLYSANKDDVKDEKCLTPFNGISVQLIEYNKKYPEKMLLAINKDNPELYDVYLLNSASNKLELIEKNNGSIVDWASNEDLEIKASIGVLSDGRQELLFKNGQGDWESHFVWNLDEEPNKIYYTSNGKCYFIDYSNSSTNQLVEYDIDRRHRQIIATDKEFDIQDILWDKKAKTILAVSYNKLYLEWEIIDPVFKAIYQKLRALDSGDLNFVSRDNDDKKWIVAFNKDTAPVKYYLYDSELDSALYLGTAYPELEKYDLCEMKPICFKSRDGLNIHGYLTQAKAIQPAPLILFVHGGPWVRDSWGYSPMVQWLANRGYNVLQVNYRGSTGYEKDFEKAGDREWGRKMHDDLLDGITWLTDKGIADPKKVAIFGGSYGGYAALVGAAFTPDIFCCAIDIVGPSNLVTLLSSIPPYWKLIAHKFTRAMGDIETEKELLMERSPLFKADQIKIPLLIGQGAHDPRVKQAESEQIVEALRKHNVPYTYKLYEDEGHGFSHSKNRLDFFKEMELFLKKYLPITTS